MSRPTPLPLDDDPLWYKDAVVYQLHVKSFFDGNDDGIGDFRGLVSKLDYIRTLGANTIWLLPFYPSPRRDDGYDISDYRDVHPDYGALSDFRRLVREAHERGLRVVTELVINHTSDQHPWFQRARRAKKGSVWRDFYVWSDDAKQYKDTRIIFVDTEKSNWTWDPVANAYFWHRFYSHQPDLNFDNPHVLEEVVRVMRFWLDIGVDGLRLDAVPYLVEREGTTNENLTETHAILKRIRTELDRGYRNRMLLAEANQWPEDARQYFGDGDECHMAFHFPLMPRMYMAIAQEDRFPITDILRQTPEIPENCQWCVFLRNHDELTLEMVTDRERDYLWETYATDRRARINLGIRRRLAPLMQRDRRRIELMNGLLLSMPGTPVVYYGDEIGMGDNIHLGDRDGVRTPMQWSPDRNGGFSRANPAALTLPQIMDPVWGFQAVNVEAQSEDPHSLLSWMRRMLAVRKRYCAFGRGTFRFLYPGNRKVLAFIREHEEEALLCVYNLSRTAQAVELDLGFLDGRVPLEVVGNSAFPPIGQLTYLLTLPPYGFYWFELATKAALPSWHNPAPEQMPEYVTLVIRADLAEILDGPARRQLEQEVLPVYLPKRRWFAAKDERIQAVRVAAATRIPAAPDPILLVEVEVEFGSRKDRYQVPLGVVWEAGQITALQHQLALSRMRQAARPGLLSDAFAIDALPRVLLAAFRGDLVAPREIEFSTTSLFASAALPEEPEIRRLGSEQSNSSLIIGEVAILKLIRRLGPGIHPEAEMGRFLSEAGYQNTPPLLGEIVRKEADGTRWTLGTLTGFVRNQGDGWEWSVEQVSRLIGEAVLLGEAPEASAERAFLSFIEAAGRRLGELHKVLAEAPGEGPFAPEFASSGQAERWRERAMTSLARAFDAMQTAAPNLPGLQRPVSEIRAARSRIEGRIGRLAEAGVGSLLIRIHGDLHLGQLLYVQGDAFVVDFEGEPARGLEERRAKDSPMRDVAGLFRSLDYLASTVAAAATGELPEALARRLGFADDLRRRAEEVLLKAYRSHRPQRGLERDSDLLELFLIEKAAYEVAYEAANRPDWIGIPIRGLAGLLHPERIDA